MIVAHNICQTHPGKSKAKEEREANDKEVPGGVEADVLEGREANGGDHGKDNAEDAPNDGFRYGDEEGSNLAHHTTHQHDSCTVLHHTATAHLKHHHNMQVNRLYHHIPSYQSDIQIIGIHLTRTHKDSNIFKNTKPSHKRKREREQLKYPRLKSTMRGNKVELVPK